jgi:hypothetical protein
VKSILLIVLFVLSWIICGEAQAQFSQPPPSTPPPSCSREKHGDAQPPSSSDCKAVLAAPLTSISIDCHRWSESVSCHAAMLVYSEGGWELLDPSTLTHHWAHKVDGVEVYMPPNHSDSLILACGHAPNGYVRVAAGGDVAQVEFQCPSPTFMDW